MCIAIVQPPQQRLTKEEAKASWDSNSHGGGVAYIEDGLVKTQKVLDNFEEFWRVYNEVSDNFGANNVFVHFRIKTHGAATIENTHPFVINDGKYAVMHNGVISAITDMTSEARSDTRAFAEEILAKLPDGWFMNPIYGRLLSTYIGNGSKVAVMRNDGAVWIINDKVGTAHYGRDGFWFSNSSYKPYTPVYSGGGRQQSFFKNISGTIGGIKYEYDDNSQKVTIEKDGTYEFFWLTTATMIYNFGLKYQEVLEKLDEYEDGLYSDVLTNFLYWKSLAA